MQELQKAVLEEEIRRLNPEKRAELTKLLVDVLNDRVWCKTHGIRYTTLEAEKAELILYRELKEFGYFESKLFKPA